MTATGNLFLDYKQLVDDPKTDIRSSAERTAGLDELAAQINAKGLLQPIIVRPAGKSSYAITDGRRRTRAIGQLIKRKLWDGPIPVVVRKDDDAGAHETALMANVGRRQMHPVDQFEAFAKLESDGMTVAEIAARNGCEEKVVRQSLALGKLATNVRAAWRAGEISADVARAFAICPDRRLQAATFERLKKDDNLYDHSIRKALVNDRPRLTDKRVTFVGLDRYRAEGGEVVDSLFGDDGYLVDGALLKRMIPIRVDEETKRLLADGWAWVEAGSNFGWMKRVEPKPVYVGGEREQLKALDKEVVRQQELEDADWDELQRLEAQIEDIQERARLRGFKASQKAQSGVTITITEAEVRLDYGLIRDEAKPAPNGKASPAPASKLPDSKPAGEALSSALMVDVTTVQTLAAARAMSEQPQLGILLATVALSSQYGPIKLSSQGHEQLRNRSGGPDFSKRLNQLQAMTPAEVGMQLAECVGRAFNLVSYNVGSPQPAAKALIAALPGAAYLKAAREIFVADDYFKRAPMKVAEKAIAEIEGKGGIGHGAKKADLVKRAADLAKRAGWLPPEIRHPDYKLIEPDKPKYVPPEERARRAMKGARQ